MKNLKKERKQDFFFEKNRLGFFLKKLFGLNRGLNHGLNQRDLNQTTLIQTIEKCCTIVL